MSNTLLDIDEVCERLGVSRRTLHDWWATGRGPRRIKLPNRRVVVRASVLNDWLLGLEEESAA